MGLLASGSNDPAAVLLNYGAIGAMLVVLGLFAWSSYKRERDRADRLEGLLQTTNERIADRFAIVLKESTDALGAAGDYLRDVARRRR